jgi:hypothetical protein
VKIKELFKYSTSLAITAPIVGALLLIAGGLVFRIFTGDLGGVGKTIASTILGAPIWGAGSFFFGLIPAFFTGLLSYSFINTVSKLKFLVLLILLGSICEFLFICLIFDFKQENLLFLVGLPIVAGISSSIFFFLNSKKLYAETNA